MYEVELHQTGYPDILAKISKPPSKLFVEGIKLGSLAGRIHVGIVGSRKLTDYGREVTRLLASELARLGVVIVSGLALGVDSVAHQAALDARGTTLAILPSDLDNIYPSSHRQLAKRIVEQGGALISEYGPGKPSHQASYVERNRIISGLSRGVLIVESAEKSGTLHTANFALEQGREVMAVPGSIFSHSSKGTNNLIKSGATVVTSVDDVLQALKLEKQMIQAELLPNASSEELVILTVLENGETDAETLFEQSKLPISLFNQTLSNLEIVGRIKRIGAKWTIA